MVRDVFGDMEKHHALTSTNVHERRARRVGGPVHLAALGTSLGGALAVTACFASFASAMAGVDVAWRFPDDATCDAAGVTRIAVTATGDDESTSTRWFACDLGQASLVIPAGAAQLVVEGFGDDDDAGAARYRAQLEVETVPTRTLDAGEVRLEPLVTGDLLLRVVLDPLCAAALEPDTVVVTVDGVLAAPPISGPFCIGNEVHVVVFDLPPGPHTIAVLGFNLAGRTLFQEPTVAAVEAGMLLIVVVDIGASPASPPPEPDEPDAPDGPGDPRAPDRGDDERDQRRAPRVEPAMRSTGARP